MKRPEIKQTVLLGKGVNSAKIAAVYDGVKTTGTQAIYSVKVDSGDIYDVVSDGSHWKAIR